MSGSVDVLAVMDAAIDNLEIAGLIGSTIRLKEARAAVAELINAATQAQSDLSWAERTVPGTNFRSSLILLEAALPAFTASKDDEGAAS